MAGSQYKVDPKGEYALKVISYFDEVTKIKNDDERYACAIHKEPFLTPILEVIGSKYYDAKKQLYESAETTDVDTGAIADAIIILQNREARKTGIYGTTGIIAVPKRDDGKTSTDEIVEDIEIDASDMPEVKEELDKDV